MIIIKIHQGKWQIHIGDEIWQFETTEEFQNTLNILLMYKEKFGKINNG